MADPDALRALQNRLATQLEAALAQDRGESWLAVEAGGAGLLLPLADAGEIFPFRGALRVPHTRPWFLGVADLRGTLHGVTDLARFLGLPGPPPGAAAATADAGWLVALNPRLESLAALRVDRLAGLRRADQLEALDPAPGAGARPAFAGALFREPAAAGGARPWQEIRLAALAADGHFVDIGRRP
ncbi:chemotaxis protein CheW [Piscinibacter sakaiensis]|uniref:Type IV pili signal transduction protein PilI n=1 Tax=Piscinibacter sakaiensis TaxID=1547922 RepID=A0A0K8NWK3_PISS1|nr:chemotaxis protein CheW [Piscinibacter sakaiensis]GAP34782.1 type IV pili signal transduction protein PilI [Piscinibacter sakaiensis]